MSLEVVVDVCEDQTTFQFNFFYVEKLKIQSNQFNCHNSVSNNDLPSEDWIRFGGFLETLGPHTH